MAPLKLFSRSTSPSSAGSVPKNQHKPSQNHPTLEEMRQLYKFRPIPQEGAFFTEPGLANETIPAEVYGDRYPGPRAAYSIIHALITADSFSALHRLKSDEIYSYHFGDPLDLLLLDDRGARQVTLGSDPKQGMQSHLVVPRGVWQGSRVRSSGSYAFVSCTVTPAFAYSDYEHGHRRDLLRHYPQHSALIETYTREES
jgi:uncharacterized protein